jgi:uncharacterized protein YjbI with pentapeptide repeats
MDELSDETLQNHTDGTALKGKRYYDCKLVDARLAHQTLGASEWIDCEFINCDLSSSNLGALRLRSCLFINCRLTGVNWAGIHDLDEVSFRECKLNDSIFMTMDLRNFKFSDCQLTGVDFSEANLEGVKLEGCELSKATFRQTNLKKSDFSTARNYSIGVADNQMKDAKFSLPEAMSLLQGLGIKLV